MVYFVPFMYSTENDNEEGTIEETASLLDLELERGQIND